MNEIFFFFEPRNNVKVKHIESNKPREIYHASIVLFQTMSEIDLNKIFTIMDHFINMDGWFIKL